MLKNRRYVGYVVVSGSTPAPSPPPTVPDHPGTGSALLGFVQWVAACAIAPLAGLGGERTAVPMALLMIAGTAASMGGLLFLVQPHQPRS